MDGADAGTSVDGGNILDGAAGGDTGPPRGTFAWAKALGVDGETAATGRVDPTNGDVALTGFLGAVSGPYSSGSADFGDGGLLGNVPGGDATFGGPGAFVARFGASGAYQWALFFGGDVRPSDVAVDGAGNVVIAGAFRGSTDFGDGVVSATGTQDLFFASFNSAGTLLWEKEFGVSATTLSVSRMVVDKAGNIFVVADPAHAALDLGCGPIAAGNAEVIAKLDPLGVCVWSTPSGGGRTPDQDARPRPVGERAGRRRLRRRGGLRGPAPSIPPAVRGPTPFYRSGARAAPWSG